MDACNVCGGKDMNLVDGFYYCVECGTQDVNVRETIVEQTVMGDGTFAHTTSRKITTVVKDGIEMSSEWHKWHIFNFILVGLTDELIALGAKPTLKLKVLWIWTRYIKQFQNKEDIQSKLSLGVEDDDENEDDNENDKESSCDDNSDCEPRNQKLKKSKSDRIIHEIKTITKGTILTILYVALNLDRSEIQLSHLFRFIREGRLSLYDCMKFVPKELKMNLVKNWKSFTLSPAEYNPVSIRKFGLTCFKILKLGVPLVPDLRKLVGNFIKELCLPSDVKELVFALMQFVPIDFLHIDAKIQKSLVRIPDYEGICMAYILIALKICFGLDDDYDVRISKEVDKINDNENYLKSYKLGLFCEPSDRLFSFNEWCQHLQFRKHILCKSYLPMSRQFNIQTDVYTYMEHLEKRRKREVKLSDDVTMDILNKIKSDEAPQVIPKADFPATLTPMTTYTDVIAQHAQDPDLKLLLCEDFTQYSLKYAIKIFTLSDHLSNLDNSIIGVCKSEKIFNNYVIGTLTVQEGDMTMVYVRNCQNKNWLKTEPPKMHHVTKTCLNDNSRDRDSDHGYDSNTENSNPETEVTHITISDESVCKEDKVLEVIDDLPATESIFDDNLKNTYVEPSNNEQVTVKEEQEDQFFEIHTQSNVNMQDSKVDSFEKIDDHHERDVSNQFDPNTFDRDKMIKDLIELACKKYKITLPTENVVRRQSKRKVKSTEEEGSSIEPKRKRTNNNRAKSGEAKRDVDNVIFAYYNNLHNNILQEVSEQFKSIIEDAGVTNNSIMDSHTVINESSELYNQININNEENSQLHEEERSQENHTSASVTENNQAVIDSEEKTLDNATLEESIEDECLDELFPKSDPNFDEKDHDIRQLYVKLGEETDTNNVSILDRSNDPEIDKIIKKQIEYYSNIDENALDNNENDHVKGDYENFSDSDDDIPLSVIKETNCFEMEKEKRKKEKLEPLINDLSNVKKFQYWVRHYKSDYVSKSRDVGKKFDIELYENLPASFVFVIRECASIIGYSMFSLYKNMQSIEEILITNT